MVNLLDRLGYPRVAWRRPVLWTVLSAFVTVAFAFPPYTGDTLGGRFFSAVGFLVIGGFTSQSWRKHRHLPVEPLGHVEWPHAKRQ